MGRVSGPRNEHSLREILRKRDANAWSQEATWSVFFLLKRLKKKEKFSNPKLVFFILFFFYFSVFSLFLSLGVNSFLPPPSFFWNWKRYHEALGPGTAVPSSRGHWGKRGGETVFPALTLLFRCLITAFLCSRLSPSSSSLLVSSSVLLCSSWKVKRQE